MDISKCEAFLEAADRGSFTAAGMSLGYTQSGITRMINSLEEELGFSLFIRRKRGVQLTENGLRMLPVIRAAVKANKTAEELGADIRGLISGTITMGCYFSFSAILLPEILKTFEQKYPGIQIRIQEGGNMEIAEWLEEGSVDLAVGARPRETVHCKWVGLFQDQILVWLPENHPKAHDQFFQVKDLENESFIHTSPDRDTDQDRLIEAEHLTMKEKYSTCDGFTTYRMVEAGLGISFNQQLISREWHGGVAQIPLYPSRYVEIGISVPETGEASPAGKVFIRHIQEYLSSNFAENGAR